MNTELKHRWIEDMRNEAFPWGQGDLCRNGKYCAFGWLGHLAGIADHELDDSIEELCGLVGSYDAFSDIWWLNDMGGGLQAVADWAEENIVPDDVPDHAPHDVPLAEPVAA